MTAPQAAAADAELLRLETAVTAIATNLVDLDDNPARKDLDKTRLTGRTASAWADATEALAQLWDGYRILSEVVAQARALRDQRRLSDADRATFVHKVLGSSITLGTATVPLAQRGLLGAGQVHTTCTPGELLSAMEAAFGTAVDVATRAGDVWQRLLPAAAEATDAVTTVRRLTREAGGSTATIDQADRLLGQFTATLATDPLGVDAGGLDAVRKLTARADAERTSAAELKAALGRRLAEAHTLAAELAPARQAAEAALDAAADRFPQRDLAAVTGNNLYPDLAALDALAAADQWGLISPRLSDWTRRAREQLATLRDSASRNAALLTNRNEMRGRLDAYRAKALRVGLGEDAALTPLAEAARDALYSAPCDLAAARRSVDAYQEALTAAIARNNR